MLNSENKDAESKIDSFICKSEDLSNKTNEILFNWWSFKQLGTPSLEGMDNWQKILCEISSPYGSISSNSSFTKLKIVVILLWYFIETIWIALTLSILSNISNGNLSASTPPNASVSLIITIFAVVVLPVLIYLHTVWYLLTKRNAIFTKLIWLTGLATILVYTFKIAQTVELEKLARLLSYDGLWLVIVLVIIPSILVANYGILYFSKLIIESVNNLFNVLGRLFQPIPYTGIRKVISSEIISGSERWSLITSRRDDIIGLRDFAKENLEASEKKTIPIAIISAFLAFIGTLPFLNEFLNTILQKLFVVIPSIFQSPDSSLILSLSQVFIIDLGIAFILIIVTGSLLLFRNLITQGVIIQACTIALQTTNSAIEKNGDLSTTEGFFDHIISAIRVLLYKFGHKQTPTETTKTKDR